MTNKQKLAFLLDLIHDKLGEDVKVYDVGNLSPFMDQLIVVGASNIRKVHAIKDEIRKQLLTKLPQELRHIEGHPEAPWVVLDTRDIVIHILTEEARKKYNLDELFEGRLHSK